MKKLIISLITISLFLTSCSDKNIQVNNTILTETTIDITEATETTKTTKETTEETKEKISTVKLTAVGDIMAHKWQVEAAYDVKNSVYNFDEAFLQVKDILSQADITVGNLETTFGGKDRPYSFYPTFNTPDEYLKAIYNTGFDFLSTANNHSMDTRNKGLERTIDLLDSYGIKHAGTYKSQNDRDNIVVIEKNNISFAFLSYTYGTNGIPIDKNKPYSVNLIDESLIISDIKKARLLGVDFVVVMPHFGNEYETKQNKSQEQLVDKMFDAGADIILGSHAHVLQPMEKRVITNEDGSTRTGFVIYSLGNFISCQTTVPRDCSIILNLEFEKENEKAYLKEVSFIPTYVQFRRIDGKQTVRTLPVYKTLEDYNNGQGISLTEKEINRMKESVYQTLENFYNEDYKQQSINSLYIFK